MGITGCLRPWCYSLSPKCVAAITDLTNIKQINEYNNHNVTNTKSSQLISMLSILRSNTHEPALFPRSDVLSIHKPLPTHLSTSTNSMTNCFINACGVVPSPAFLQHTHLSAVVNSSNTHLPRKYGALS